jgi:hypothetical protein
VIAAAVLLAVLTGSPDAGGAIQYRKTTVIDFEDVVIDSNCPDPRTSHLQAVIVETKSAARRTHVLSAFSVFSPAGAT